MKTLLSLILVLTVTTLTLAQGKLQFAINSDNLIYFTPDRNHLNWVDASKIVNGFPLAGSGAYTGPGSTIAALDGSPTFIAALYAGWSPDYLELQTITTVDTFANEGRVVPVNVTFNTLPPGTPAWFQIQVFDSRADPSAYGGGADYAWTHYGDGYAGESPIFMATPADDFLPIYSTDPPVNSTWAPGTFEPTDLAGIFGPGVFHGGIELLAVVCLGPYWVGFDNQPTNQTVVSGGSATFSVTAMVCPAPGFQWVFTGGSIAGATDITNPGPGLYSTSLQITNAQLTDAGTYWVVAMDRYGTHVSESATLTVVAKPTITTPPQSQTAETGSDVQFYAEATNTVLASYQWFCHGTNAIAGSTTNGFLLLTNVQPSQAGAYTVVVTNLAGATTSSPAMLNVIAPVERRLVPGVKVTGQSGKVLNLDYADFLRPAPKWATVGSVSLISTSQYWFDLSLPLPRQHFFQAWQTGAAGVIPSLDLHLVPAITLAGSIGGSVRVDAINQFGPIDAWFTLDTVALTNTSQFYFDTSAWRQPQRLYRLVPVP